MRCNEVLVSQDAPFMSADAKTLFMLCLDESLFRYCDPVRFCVADDESRIGNLGSIVHLVESGPS